MKKLLSGLLVLAMLISMVPVSVFAQETEELAEELQYELLPAAEEELPEEVSAPAEELPVSEDAELPEEAPVISDAPVVNEVEETPAQQPEEEAEEVEEDPAQQPEEEAEEVEEDPAQLPEEEFEKEFILEGEEAMAKVEIAPFEWAHDVRNDIFMIIPSGGESDIPDNYYDDHYLLSAKNILLVNITSVGANNFDRIDWDKVENVFYRYDPWYPTPVAGGPVIDAEGNGKLGTGDVTLTHWSAKGYFNEEFTDPEAKMLDIDLAGMPENGTYQTHLVLNGDSAAANIDAIVHYRSENPEIATIDDEGIITFTGKTGYAWITADNAIGWDGDYPGFNVHAYFAFPEGDLHLFMDFLSRMDIGEERPLDLYCGQFHNNWDDVDLIVKSGEGIIKIIDGPVKIWDDEAGEEVEVMTKWVKGLERGTAELAVRLSKDKYGVDPLHRESSVSISVDQNWREVVFQPVPGFDYENVPGWIGNCEIDARFEKLSAERKMPIRLAYMGGDERLETKGAVNSSLYTYSTSDAKVAKLVKNRDGSLNVVIPANACGTAVLTATPVEGDKSQTVQFTIMVFDRKPVMKETKLTYNPYKNSTLMLPEIRMGMVDWDRPDQVNWDSTVLLEKVGKNYAEAKHFELYTQPHDECYDGSVHLHIVDGAPNQPYNLRLQISSELWNEEPANLDFTVTVKRTAPQVTVKQLTKANWFDGTPAVLQFTSAQSINDIKLNVPGYQGSWRSDENAWTIAPDCETTFKSSAAGTATIWFGGYEQPVQMPIKLTATNTKYTIAPDTATVTLLAGADEELASYIQLINKTTKQLIPLWGIVELNCLTDGFSAEVENEGCLKITPDDDMLEALKTATKKSTHKIKIELQRADWLVPLTVQYTLTVQPSSVVPTAKLSAATISINSMYAPFTRQDAYGSTQLVVNPENVPVSASFEYTGKGAEPNLEVKLDGTTVSVYPKYENGKALDVPKGSYTYNIIPKYVNAKGETKTLKAQKLTVKVAPTAAVVNVGKASGKLDVINRTGSYVDYPLTIKNLETVVTKIKLVSAGAETATVKDGSKYFNVEFCGSSVEPIARISLKPEAEYNTKYTYKFKFACTVLHGGEVFESKGVSLKVTQGSFKVDISFKYDGVYQSWGSAFWSLASVTDGVTFDRVEIDTSKADTKKIMQFIKNSSFSSSDDGRLMQIRIEVGGEKVLPAGKTYTLPLLCYARGAVPGSAPTKVNLTFRVDK